MRKLLSLCLALVAIGFFMPAAVAADRWVEGQHYMVLQPAQPTDVPKGKVQLVEVFSYGCPVCNVFQPTMRQFVKTLPANVVVDYVPASWAKQEDWPMFQRAYLTAKNLGISERTHDQMYNAIWGTGELGVIDKATGGLKRALPTIEDAAKFYQRTAGVPAAHFLQVAQSFGIESAIQTADRQVRSYAVDGTPTLIVNGKYRITGRSAGSDVQMVEVARWLIDRELGKAH